MKEGEPAESLIKEGEQSESALLPPVTHISRGYLFSFIEGLGNSTVVIGLTPSAL